MGKPENRSKAGSHDGFTLVELMIVVAIIGILASIAVPAFSRYVKKARTAEAVGHLNKEWAGTLTYYETDHILMGTALPKQFPGPSAAWASTTECACQTGQRCMPNNPIWSSDAVWLALSFSLADAHHYMPGYSGLGQGTAAQFTAYSKGDLNCNQLLAEFYRQGSIGPGGDVKGNVQPMVNNELE
ncbi:MAG TPA: prepilin-type N-terminal cleavage/methylation domain-containing protein [Polyangia bacterium]